jgi:hypothetical protein
MLGVSDMSKVQGPDERAQGAHLPQAAEVEMSDMRQSQDAEAKISCRYFVSTGQARELAQASRNAQDRGIVNPPRGHLFEALRQTKQFHDQR